MDLSVCGNKGNRQHRKRQADAKTEMTHYHNLSLQGIALLPIPHALEMTRQANFPSSSAQRAYSFSTSASAACISAYRRCSAIGSETISGAWKAVRSALSTTVDTRSSM